jgi:hypothetical protein
MDNYWNDEKVIKRFFDKVNKQENCWNWTGCPGQDSYGKFEIYKKTLRAHRVSFEIANKRFITNGMSILHSCDNTMCVNPLHLSEGTHQENMKDRNNKNRQARLKGELNGQSKLTEQQVIEIREKYSSGNYTQSLLANEYNTKQQNICRIVNYKRWK